MDSLASVSVSLGSVMVSLGSVRVSLRSVRVSLGLGPNLMDPKLDALRFIG